MHGGLCPVSYAPSPAPRARVSRVLLPAASSPCSAFCVLRSAFCVLHPVPPCPRARARARAPVPVPASASTCSASTCSAFCVLRPTPASSVFRTRAPHPAPVPVPVPVPPSPAPRARARGSVFCVPRTVARVPRPASPPRTSGRLLPASASRRDEKKIGRLPRGTSRFCMHCSGARLTRACG